MKNYFIGRYLEKSINVFEKARVEILFTFSVILFATAVPYEISLVAMGYHLNAYINIIPILCILLLFYFMRKGKSIYWLGIFYGSVQLGNSLLHGLLMNYKPSLQGILWMQLGVLGVFFLSGRKAGLLFSFVLLIYLIFGLVNQACGFCFLNMNIDPKFLMPDSDMSMIVPFFLNIYMIWLFMRTTARAETDINASHRRNEELLLNILPSDTANELLKSGNAETKYYQEVTVLFADIKDFSRLAAEMEPKILVEELHTCFKGFDEILSKYHIEKIKTIGDAYLCASGIPKSNPSHAADVIKAAKEFVTITTQLNAEREKQNKPLFEFRIGIHTGPIVAGVVGIKKFAYDIWGDTVNTAARMQEAGLPGKINISETTFNIVKDQFQFTDRGEIEAKNKGMLKMFFVND